LVAQRMHWNWTEGFRGWWDIWVFFS